MFLANLEGFAQNNSCANYICIHIHKKMFNKGSKLYSILLNKCPHCHQGHFFNSSNPFNLRQFDKMENNCSVCNSSFMPETGFYFGAMFVSYALNVAIMVTLWLGIELLGPDNLPLAYYLIGIIVPSVLLVPLTFRLARLIWINIFVRYKGR
jgi:uncharacterized protein (DUF983 family)